MCFADVSEMPASSAAVQCIESPDDRSGADDGTQHGVICGTVAPGTLDLVSNNPVCLSQK